MRRILPLSPMLLTTRLPGTHSLTDLKFSAAAVRAPAMKAAVRTRVVSTEGPFNLVSFRRMADQQLYTVADLAHYRVDSAIGERAQGGPRGAGAPPDIRGLFTASEGIAGRKRFWRNAVLFCTR